MPEITFTCSDDDSAWLTEQAQGLGIDDIGITVRIIVRNARNRDVQFGIVANGEQLAPVARSYAHRHAYALERNPEPEATTPFENEPAEEVEVPPDDVVTALAEASSAVDAMVAQPRAAAPSPTYRHRAAALRSQPSHLRVFDGPGSRTQAVDAGELLHTDPRLLDPKAQVTATNLRRQMDGHFGNLRRA